MDKLTRAILDLDKLVYRKTVKELTELVVTYIHARAAKYGFAKEYYEHVAMLKICRLSPTTKTIIEEALKD